MCLITAVPKGKAKNIKDIEGFVKSGMNTNDDGSGFMYKIHGKDTINIHKGFRDENLLVKAIEKLNLKPEDELVIHHRWGTSGLKNDINMHPFVVSNNALLLQTIEGEVNLPAMAHNGVFSDYTNNQSVYNDTYHFTSDFLAVPEILELLSRDPREFEKCFKKIINYNKLALLFPKRDMVLLGDFTEDDGYYHSNVGYKRPVYDKGGKQTDLYSKYGYYGSDAYAEDDEDRYNTRSPKLVVPKIENKPKLDYNKLLEIGKEVQLRFDSELINVTKENHKHFILLAKVDSKLSYQAKKAYLFENYSPDSIMNYIYAYTDDKVMHLINWNMHKQDFVIIVKEDYRSFYEGLFNLTKTIGKAPSKSMLKKMSKYVTSRKTRVNFKYKDYGYIFFKDFKYLVDKYTNDDLTDIKGALGIKPEDNFTLNEDFMS